MAKGSLNKVQLIGHVGKDPDIKHSDSGLTIASFSVATTEKRKDKEESTEWHRCVSFGKLAEIIEKYIKKGAMIYVEGKINYQKWTDKEGNIKNGVQITVDSMQMLGGGERVNIEPETTDKLQDSRNTVDMPFDDIPF